MEITAEYRVGVGYFWMHMLPHVSTAYVCVWDLLKILGAASFQIMGSDLSVGPTFTGPGII